MNRFEDKELLHYWKERWLAYQAHSLLRQTQIAGPERWADFYDTVAALWEKISGMGPETARSLTRIMLDHHLAGAGDSVLDLGCGPGSLSLALAEKDMKVTALDRSAAMAGLVKQRTLSAGPLSLDTRICDWKQIVTGEVWDMVLAACFPDAFCPEGIQRMETFASKRCVLVMGGGRESFPLRRRIWDQVMDHPCPVTGFHLECAPEYLKAAGRAPKVFQHRMPVTLDAGYETIMAFYTAYFKLLGKTGKDVETTIHQVAAPYLRQGRVTIQGEVDLAVVAWRPESATRNMQ